MTATPTTNILMVCSGNICRSPLAEAAAAEHFSSDNFQVSSAGSVAVPGQQATLMMREVAMEHGLDLTDHVATPLHEAPVPDLVFGMEQEHLIAAKRAFPDLPPGSIRLLDHPHAIADPYGRDLAEYRASAAHIMAAVARLDVS
ncbi:MAG: low molecular weight phosphotyrosine protein phosphatase [Acidimicrobiia bacterium]